MSRYKGAYNWIPPTSKSKLSHHQDSLSSYELAGVWKIMHAQASAILFEKLAACSRARINQISGRCLRVVLREAAASSKQAYLEQHLQDKDARDATARAGLSADEMEWLQSLNK